MCKAQIFSKSCGMRNTCLSFRITLENAYCSELEKIPRELQGRTRTWTMVDKKSYWCVFTYFLHPETAQLIPGPPTVRHTSKNTTVRTSANRLRETEWFSANQNLLNLTDVYLWPIKRVACQGERWKLTHGLKYTLGQESREWSTSTLPSAGCSQLCTCTSWFPPCTPDFHGDSHSIHRLLSPVDRNQTGTPSS